MRAISLSGAVFLLTALPVVAQEPGNSWDITTSMEMAGMKMPGQRQKFCAPVNA